MNIVQNEVGFPSWYFYINNYTPPSKKMMFTLEKCMRWEVVTPWVPYGPIDINGSFNGLLSRELIGIRKLNTKLTWFVTDNGKSLLKQIA